MNIGDYPGTADFDSATFDPPVFQTLGGHIEAAGEGRARVRFPWQDRFSIPEGVLQGGMQAALIDEAMIVAVRTVLPLADDFTTAELKVNYLRPAAGPSFLCEAEVVRKGRNLIYVEASLSDDQGRLVARASSTLARVHPRGWAPPPAPLDPRA